MTERQKSITQWLFWGAFGVFLGVSIPHIAWVVRQYMPLDALGLEDWGYNTLSVGYAIAIDGIMAWLTHAQSSHQTRQKWWSFSRLFTWTFIIALVLMSWYLNWVYNIAHDPSKQITNVWTIILTNQFGYIPQITVGEFTPLLLAALPVFTIAYVGVLNNVNHIKEQAAKSIEELEAEALDSERRAIAQRRIREAQKNAGAQVDIFGASESIIKGAARLRKTVGSELVKDVQQENLEKVLKLFRDTPALLNEENAVLAETAIKQVLKLKRKDDDVARFWRLKAAQIITHTPNEAPTEKPAPQEPQTAREDEIVESVAVAAMQLETPVATVTTEENSLSIAELVRVTAYTQPEQVEEALPVASTTGMSNAYAEEAVATYPANTQPNPLTPLPFTDEFMEDKYEEDELSYPNTGTLSNQTLGQGQRSSQAGVKKGSYAITKEMAALSRGYSMTELESAIKDGQIKTFAKDRNKILVSSLENWDSEKKQASAKLEAITKN